MPFAEEKKSLQHNISQKMCFNYWVFENRLEYRKNRFQVIFEEYIPELGHERIDRDRQTNRVYKHFSTELKNVK